MRNVRKEKIIGFPQVKIDEYEFIFTVSVNYRNILSDSQRQILNQPNFTRTEYESDANSTKPYKPYFMEFKIRLQPVKGQISSQERKQIDELIALFPPNTILHASVKFQGSINGLRDLPIVSSQLATEFKPGYNTIYTHTFYNGTMASMNLNENNENKKKYNVFGECHIVSGECDATKPVRSSKIALERQSPILSHLVDHALQTTIEMSKTSTIVETIKNGSLPDLSLQPKGTMRR